jgi:hypothetical protein
MYEVFHASPLAQFPVVEAVLTLLAGYFILRQFVRAVCRDVRGLRRFGWLKAVLFAAAFLGAAWAFHHCVARRGSEEGDRKRDRAALREQYLHPLPPVAPADVPRTLFLVVRVDGATEPAANQVAASVARMATERGWKTANGVFTPAFLAGPEFDAVLQGNAAVLARFGITERTGGVLAVKARVAEPVANEGAVAGTFSVRVSAAVAVAPAGGPAALLAIDAAGAGFDAAAATRAAIDRLADQLDEKFPPAP